MSELTLSPELLQISAEVQDALKNKKPVVALESTIISHGMPFPQNAQTAIEVEETIRKQGAVPATIAIIGGVMKVGLSKEEIELLGREGHNVTKVSRRDLPFVVAAGKNGATTVASTMIIAALAGIKVFATGGIGGVHRGAEHTFDISADLQELANTNVTVVCAGAKSILDLGLTTEYLETFGVPLIGYQTKALPAFFCRTSSFDVSIRLDSASEIARAMAVKWQSGLNGGLVVANPIPEQFAMPEESINAAIDQAVAEAEEQGEEDDLEHVALGEGLNGVDRDDVQEHVDEGGRGDFLGLEAFRGNGQPAAGLEDVGEYEADDHGDGRGYKVIGQRLAGYAPKFAYVADAGRTRDEGGQHERHHDHAHQIDEQLAYGLVP